MPGFDATGPRGMGPGTGWGRGPCGAGLRRGASRGWGRGIGRGAYGWGGYGFGGGAWGGSRGGGRAGFGPFGAPGAYAPGSPGDEASALREEESALKANLEAVQKRLAELEEPQT